MKPIVKLFFFAIILFSPFTNKAQWLPSSVGNTSGVTHCFIESSGVLLSGGNGSSIYSSTNFGDTWTVSNTGINPGAEVLCFGKNSAGIFAGSDGSIYFSGNNGASWIEVNNSGNYVFQFAKLSDTVFAATMGGGIIMSSNNGLTWNSADSGVTTTLIHSIIKKDNKLFAGTDGEGIFVSSNSGVSWSSLNTSPSIIESLETDGTNIYASTGSGFYISSDDGVSWTQVSAGLFGTITSIGNALLASSLDIYRSLDDGLTWSIFMYGITPTCNYGAAGFLETSDYVFSGFEGGCNGSVFRIEKNEVLPVSKIIPENNFFSVYPNPSTQNITVTTNEESGKVILFDFLGKQVMEKETAHEKQTVLNISSLSTGIYFLQFSSAKKILTAKIVKE